MKFYECNGTDEVFEQLSSLIERENARKVFDFFKGSSFYFPKRIATKEIHRKIVEELRAGKEYRELVNKYGYS